MPQLDLNTYRKVASGKRLPGFVRAGRRRVGVKDLSSLDIGQLWALHDDADEKRSVEYGVSLLDLKIELAHRILADCVLCERRCQVNRIKGEKGFCGVGHGSNYFFDDILWGEEPPLVPSHEVLFSGCNMRCSYCYSWESVLDTAHGRQFVPEGFARTVDCRKSDGATNLNLLGGEPTVHLRAILEMLKHISCRTAVVWNSNFCMSDVTMRLLRGIVDLYVGDFRFGNDRCARELADTDGYFAAAARNFMTAAASGDLIIRHLVIPGHIECCLLPVARWVSEHLPEVPFNLMFQYIPCHRALNDTSIGRSLSPAEEERAREIVSSFNLDTERWKRPIATNAKKTSDSSRDVEVTITIRPDGRVGIMRLHGELLELVEALRGGE